MENKTFNYGFVFSKSSIDCAYFEKWSRFVRTTTLTWVSTTWSPSLKRWWTSSWCSNSTSGHATDLILVSNPRFLGARNHFGPFPEALDWIEGQ